MISAAVHEFFELPVCHLVRVDQEFVQIDGERIEIRQDSQSRVSSPNTHHSGWDASDFIQRKIQRVLWTRCRDLDRFVSLLHYPPSKIPQGKPDVVDRRQTKVFPFAIHGFVRFVIDVRPFRSRMERSRLLKSGARCSRARDLLRYMSPPSSPAETHRCNLPLRQAGRSRAWPGFWPIESWHDRWLIHATTRRESNEHDNGRARYDRPSNLAENRASIHDFLVGTRQIRLDSYEVLQQLRDRRIARFRVLLQGSVDDRLETGRQIGRRVFERFGVAR